MTFPALYKRSSTGKISYWQIQVEDNKYRTISGFTDGEKVISAWTECIGKNKGKSNSTDANKQALQQAKSLHKKRVEKGSFENVADIDNEVYFKPILALDYKDYVDDIKYPIGSDRKYDGVRCLCKEDGMYSRNGKKIISAPHIYNSLKPLFDIDPDLILDGELFCEKSKANFNKIISLVRKTKPEPEDLIESEKYIQYYIYDLPSCDENFLKRKEELKNIPLPKCCVIVETIMVNNQKELDSEYKKYLDEEFEGQIIRLDGPYENKRSKFLLKRKEFFDEEFIIEGVIEGVGNLSNKVGKLKFKTKNGVEFEAAINATWLELEEMWKNRNELIGKSATVKYFEKTTDGSLRFPKVTQIDRSWE